ncbi:MAG: hypothetical protein PUI29_00720 [Aeromonadales bacterium]|nr:hypothetical protein [Aeromonadales bacterium]MDY2890882.1 hypothetical protein [Succinivibrio sp.]
MPVVIYLNFNKKALIDGRVMRQILPQAAIAWPGWRALAKGGAMPGRQGVRPGLLPCLKMI